MQRKKTTSEILDRVGVSHQGLISYLVQHTDLRPAERLPNGDYLWNEDEIERLIAARATRRRRKKTA